MADSYRVALLEDLVAQPQECEWVEFKQNNADPQEIGEYLSALANSAALVGRANGFIVWGVTDDKHEIVGTSFKPRRKKIGNEEFEPWLMRSLEPRIAFVIHEFEYQSRSVVIFEVPAAAYQPVRFKGEEFVRIGSSKRRLKDYPEKERQLWATFQSQAFEQGIAASQVAPADVLDLIDYPATFRLLGQRLPPNQVAILDRLVSERIIAPTAGGRFDVTNLGAILFARQLDQFSGLRRKAIRLIFYDGTNRTKTIREQVGARGYAIGFKGFLAYLNGFLPRNEHIGQALRAEEPMFPELAIRELVANALIHQDFSLTGTGPMVEVFIDRIEITNPGVPLISPLRFIDEPPQSRNEDLASVMRRLNICEERGSGIDKVIAEVELYQLPAPDFQVTANHTRVVLQAPKTFAAMSQEERIRACYQHTVLCWVSNRFATNATVRKRFGLSEHNAAMASRIIGDTVKAELIKPADPKSTSKKFASYVPFWE